MLTLMHDNERAATSSRRRDGCLECRRMKTKCDLKRPTRSRCSRFPNLCKYKHFVNFASSLKVPDDSSSRTDVAIQIQHPAPLLSRHGADYQSRFLLHHFGTQTVALLFPLAPGSFTSQLISTALDSPCLFFALLAASSSHYSRVIADSSLHKVTLEYTNLAMISLRQDLAAQKTIDIDHVATAIALCTNDICSGTQDSYRAHLAGARNLLQASQTIQPADLNASFKFGLTKWFPILDVCASASGNLSIVAHDDKHPVHDLITRPSQIQVEDFCGYSLEIMPSILSIEKLSSRFHGQDSMIP
jgi:hypothetical protein